MKGLALNSDSVTPERMTWGMRRWLSRPSLTEAETLLVVEVMLEPGFGHTFHLHPNQEEVLYVLEGTIEHYIETERTVLSAGGTAFMKRGTVHASFNCGDEVARILAIVGPCKNVGDDGYEVIEVANAAPWSMLRQHVTRID